MKIAVIGCGVMGSALARHFSEKYQLILCDRHAERTTTLALEITAQFMAQPIEAIEQSQMVVLAFKPKDLAAFARDTSAAFTSSHTVVSILAGTPIAMLKTYFPKSLIVRAIPNLPMVCGQGVIGFAGTPEINEEQKKLVDEVFYGLGLLTWLSEDHLEALSALAGSGPAFVLVIIEAMIDSGVKLGFSPQEAREYVLKTIEGSAALLKAAGKTPKELVANIASPGGTTMAGLKVMEESGIRDILMKTFRATLMKARELHS